MDDISSIRGSRILAARSEIDETDLSGYIQKGIGPFVDYFVSNDL